MTSKIKSNFINKKAKKEYNEITLNKTKLNNCNFSISIIVPENYNDTKLEEDYLWFVGLVNEPNHNFLAYSSYCYQGI